MTTLDVASGIDRAQRTPTDLLLTASLAVAPLLYLLVDVLYVIRGWDDADAGAFHVLGAIAYGFVVIRVASWARGWLAAATLLVGVVGVAGNAAYGFNSIHVALGAVDLVDTSGPGAIIKPLGLFCPLGFLLCAVVLATLGRRWNAVLVGAAALAWPVAHIGNVGWLAVTINVLLVLGFGSLVTTGREGPRAP